EEAGEVYWGDTDSMTKISYGQSDSFAFRTWWTYQPSFRILNQNDFLRSMAVMLMMFLFIFIVCLITALVVCYTRCQTIVLNNRYIFDDLKKLGASPDFLCREVCNQCNNVFKIPSLVGMFAMYLLFMMILYANDGRILFTEWMGSLVCLAILAVIGAVIYAVYRASVVTLKRQLEI
ncbi:MAG: ABC transporter permease, partial [Lachnospiraceae bacterium]|nr:ABC transporter permease [Lachnospiraceae bacterium]